jgi:hypothetical protein
MKPLMSIKTIRRSFVPGSAHYNKHYDVSFNSLSSNNALQQRGDGNRKLFFELAAADWLASSFTKTAVRHCKVCNVFPYLRLGTDGASALVRIPDVSVGVEDRLAGCYGAAVPLDRPR